MEEREKKLPKWARKKLEELRHRIQDLEGVREASAVLTDRDWFTLRGPLEQAGERECISLFILDPDRAHKVCSLYRGDLLLVGRSLGRRPWAKKAL